MIIKTSSIKSTEIREIIQELETNKELMDFILGNNLSTGDYLETIASHIMYTDTDYDTDTDSK